MRRHLAIIGAIAGLLASGCGGGSSSSSGDSAGAYVKTVCTAVRNWAQQIEARSGALNLATITNAKQGKAAIQQFFNGAVADTGTVVSRLKSAGTPAVENGSQIASGLQASFAKIDTALTQGERQANALPTDDPAAFRNGGRALAGSVQHALANVGAGLSGLRSPELAKAAAKQPACAPLGA